MTQPTACPSNVVDAPSAFHGQRGVIEVTRAQLRDLAGQLSRPSGRAAWLADLRMLPRAVRWALPWAVLGRISRDANPWRWLERQARARPNTAAVSDPSRSLTFSELHDESRALATALARLGAVADSRVAILLPTSSELVATIFACWWLGAIPCPLDPNAPESVLTEIRSRLKPTLEIEEYGQLRQDSRELSEHERGLSRTRLHASSVAMILPTSGSEGKVKLCRITAGRLLLSGHAFGGIALGCRRGDVIYCPLPLCHATGITVALMPALVHGVTLHLPGKFSLSSTLLALRTSGATQLIYVGDMLRILMAALHNDEIAPHRIRVAVGNGLDEATYCAAVERLRLPRIVEFYGATEAPRLLLNLSGTPGSCGRVALRRASRFLVVRDIRDGDDSGQPRWIECEPGEVGELWIRIPRQQGAWLGDFEGYLDQRDDEGAIVEGVFRPGDRFYRTYDLVRFDADDHFYFVDRLGDVWRNKGHNVSPSWLARELRQVPGVEDASVIPVGLDGSSRRFGLALLVMADRDATRDALTQELKTLPSYARPHIFQFLQELPRTASFKPAKTNCRGTQWEPPIGETSLYVWDQGLRETRVSEWVTERARLLSG